MWKLSFEFGIKEAMKLSIIDRINVAAYTAFYCKPNNDLIEIATFMSFNCSSITA